MNGVFLLNYTKSGESHKSHKNDEREIIEVVSSTDLNNKLYHFELKDGKMIIESMLYMKKLKRIYLITRTFSTEDTEGAEGTEGTEDKKIISHNSDSDSDDEFHLICCCPEKKEQLFKIQLAYHEDVNFFELFQWQDTNIIVMGRDHWDLKLFSSDGKDITFSSKFPTSNNNLYKFQWKCGLVCQNGVFVAIATVATIATIATAKATTYDNDNDDDNNHNINQYYVWFFSPDHKKKRKIKLDLKICFVLDGFVYFNLVEIQDQLYCYCEVAKLMYRIDVTESTKAAKVDNVVFDISLVNVSYIIPSLRIIRRGEMDYYSIVDYLLDPSKPPGQRENEAKICRIPLKFESAVGFPKCKKNKMLDCDFIDLTFYDSPSERFYILNFDDEGIWKIFFANATGGGLELKATKIMKEGNINFYHCNS